MDATSNAQKILDIANRVREHSDKLPKLAEQRSSAEREYQIASAKAYFMLRQAKLSQGDAKEMVKGIDEDMRAMLNITYSGLEELPLVADLRFARDSADAIEDANKRALRAAETELSGYQSVQRDFKEL